MRVSELAKELKTTNEAVLSKLRALKLKAKDGNQVLNKVVLTVIRSELLKDFRNLPEPGSDKKKAAPVKKPVVEAVAEETEVKKAGTRKKKAAVKDVKKEKEEEPVQEDKKKVKPEPAAKPVKAEESKKEKVSKEKTEEKKTFEKQAPPEKKAPATEAAKPEAAPVKKKIKKSAQPFIPLKPLAKRRKSPRKARDDRGKGADHGSADRSLSVGDGAGAGTLGSGQEGVEKKNEELTPLEVKIPITVKEFASCLQQKTGVILKQLMRLNVFANINQSLDEDVVKKLAEDFGYHVTKLKTQEQQLIESHLSKEDDPKLLKPRAPVITLMGHVDHGKTSLLDQIRKSKIVDREYGGITQHIGAYSVRVPKGTITFLDTPGHAAFTAMRARGAHITDIVILVVAADEGIMPQTREAIDHARAAGVPIVVALNKIDRKNADPDRVKKELASHGLNPEEWGGDTIVVGVSAITGEGIDTLLEMILLESEMLELKANAQREASGIVVEAHLSRGKGSVATLIVQNGTLRVNDPVVVGPYYGKVKALFDCRERSIESAGPSTPVEILGLPGVPEAGENFYVVSDEKQAKEIVAYRQQQLKDERLHSKKRITLEDLYSQVQEGSVKELNVILKSDVQGSLGALRDSLEKIPSEEVKVKFIHSGVGEVNASDVILAVASNAIIIAFQVGVGTKASEELEKEPVDVREYRIIYDAVNDVRKALEGLLEPKIKRKFLSRIEVRQVFKLSKSGIIAGCYVVKGKVSRKADIDVVRNGEVVFTGKISSLKRFKDDVREVAEGYECGVSIDGFDKIEAGDVLEAFELESVSRTI